MYPTCKVPHSSQEEFRMFEVRHGAAHFTEARHEETPCVTTSYAIVHPSALRNSTEMRPKELPHLTTSYAALHPGASLKFHIVYRDETGGIAVSDHQLCYASRGIT